MRKFSEVRTELLEAIEREGLQASENALRPLRRIDFGKLVAIYDHEEAFLRQVFMSSLLQARRVRLEEGEGSVQIEARDVQAAMLMLGAAVANAANQIFSEGSKSLIFSICPYCGREVQHGF